MEIMLPSKHVHSQAVVAWSIRVVVAIKKYRTNTCNHMPERIESLCCSKMALVEMDEKDGYDQDQNVEERGN